MNHGNDGGKNSEIHFIVHTPSSNLKGNNLHMNLYNAMNVSLPSFDMIDLPMMKHDNMNKISGLEEIFVLPFSKLISGSQTLRNYFSHQKKK